MTEIRFFTTFLKQLKIPYNFLSFQDSSDLETDLDFRQTLGLNLQLYKKQNYLLKDIIKPNTITYITDELFCHYIIMQLSENEENSYLCVGPYTQSSDSDHIIELLHNNSIAPQWLPILKEHFQNITYLAHTDGLIAAVTTLATLIWGKDNFTTANYMQGNPKNLDSFLIPPDPQKSMDMFSNISNFEKLYEEENALMAAVSHGQTAKARSILSNIPLFTLEQRTEPTRNLKNHTIIMNTLFRKAAEHGGVHPLYIDQLSSSFAHRIENFSRNDNFLDLWNEMVQKYCTLVNSHTMKNYSLPIQKIIRRIDFDLSADLSLKANANYLNMSPSYLSALFKEETGQTLTDFVNQKRISQSAYLLSYTQMPISTIAQTCGILDDNYFTKLFKRYMGKTPTQYRQDYPFTEAN